MSISCVDTALRIVATELSQLPPIERHCERLRPLEQWLNSMLPPGWIGWVAMNTVAAHQKSEDPDITGRPVWVPVRRIWLTGEALNHVGPVEAQGYWRHPSWCCGWCGTDLRGQPLGPAGECPTCGGN